MVPEALIRVTGLRKVYGAHLVLDGADLAVNSGEAVALLGANGAGKTTLLKIVATLVRPTRGKATVAGFDCVREAERVRPLLGLVGHGAHIYEDLTARENLRFWATLNGLRVSGADLDKALAQVELERAASARIRTFSQGMKRRLSLARTALLQPRVLLLDEPFAGLDQRAKKWLSEQMEAFKDRGGAILMVTHSFGDELSVADRIAILSGGRIALDTARAALSADDIRRLYATHTEDIA
jgi:heme ABC exporter ATP-binding subunit CcmA